MMQRVFPATIAMLLLVVAGCHGDGGPPSKASAAVKAQMLDKAAHMNADGQALRSDGLQKRRQGQTADGDREVEQADKMISDAKLLKDKALLRDAKVDE